MSDDQIQKLLEKFNMNQLEQTRVLGELNNNISNIKADLIEMKKEIDTLRNVYHGKDSLLTRVVLLEDAQKRQDWWVKSLIGAASTLIVGLVVTAVKVFLMDNS